MVRTVRHELGIWGEEMYLGGNYYKDRECQHWMCSPYLVGLLKWKELRW